MIAMAATDLAETALYPYLSSDLLAESGNGGSVREVIVGMVISADGAAAMLFMPFVPYPLRRFGTRLVFFVTMAVAGVLMTSTGPSVTLCGTLGIASVRALVGTFGAVGCCAAKLLTSKAFSDPATGSAMMEGAE